MTGFGISFPRMREETGFKIIKNFGLNELIKIYILVLQYYNMAFKKIS